MVSLNLNFVGFWSDEVGKAVAHIAGAGFGKSEAEDVFWVSVGLLEDICDTHGKKLGFARAWSGNYEERSVDIVDGGALIFIKVIVSLFEFHKISIQDFISLIFRTPKCSKN